MELSNEEYNRLMLLPKEFVSIPKLPRMVDKKSYTIKSVDDNETFLLTVERNIICELSKSKLNNSYYKVPIFRVEYNAPPHRNPDGTLIGRNHVHIYRNGYGMSWAYPLETFSDFLFKCPNNFNELFHDFCNYCNIKNLQLVQEVISDVTEYGF